jgi:hypothetical protein
MVDYAKTLKVTPTTVLPKKMSRNSFLHEFEDGKTIAVNLSSLKYDAEMQWDYISEADRETILDWYHDSAKANGMARTFYWDDPRSGETYEARFMGPLKTSFVPGNLQSVDKIAVRLLRVSIPDFLITEAGDTVVTESGVVVAIDVIIFQNLTTEADDNLVSEAGNQIVIAREHG